METKPLLRPGRILLLRQSCATGLFLVVLVLTCSYGVSPPMSSIPDGGLHMQDDIGRKELKEFNNTE
jgi:hypothetical protein